MKSQLLIVILLLTLADCNTSELKINQVPRGCVFELQWGSTWTPQNNHKLKYIANEDSLSVLTQANNDSTTSIVKYKIDKIQGDSLFALAHQNVINFNLQDTNHLYVTDGNNISLSLWTNNQVVTHSYSTESYSVSKEVKTIISMIENVTKQEKMFD